MSGVMGEMVLLKLNLQGWVIMVKAEGLAASSIVNCFLYFDFNTDKIKEIFISD